MSTTDNEQKNKRFRSPKMQVMYACLVEPDEKEQKYTITCRIPKGEDVSAFKEAIHNAEVLNGIKGKKGVKRAIIDGDSKENEQYHGHWKVTFKTKFKVGIIDPLKRDLDPSAIEKGDRIIMYFSAYRWDYQKSIGIGFNMGNMMLLEKVTEEEKKLLGTFASAQDEFADFNPEEFGISVDGFDDDSRNDGLETSVDFTTTDDDTNDPFGSESSAELPFGSDDFDSPQDALGLEGKVN